MHVSDIFSGIVQGVYVVEIIYLMHHFHSRSANSRTSLQIRPNEHVVEGFLTIGVWVSFVAIRDAWSFQSIP